MPVFLFVDNWMTSLNPLIKEIQQFYKGIVEIQSNY